MSNSSKYGWFKASSAEILRLGSKCNILYNKSTPFTSKFGTNLDKEVGYHLGKVDLKSGSVETPGQTESFGVPNFLKILKI